MLSIELALLVFTNLAPYFIGAIVAAAILGLFLPWGVLNPHKWLFLYIIPLCLVTFGGSDASGDGSLYKQVTWGGLYTLILIILIRSNKLIGDLSVRIPPELLTLYGFIFISVIWSPYPLTSLKRSILLTGLLLIATLSTRLSIMAGSFAKMIGNSLALYILIGLIVAVLAPRLAFDSDGAMRGYTSHKNSWGMFSLLCAVTFMNNFIAGNKRYLYGIMFFLSLASLFASKSATSIIAFVVSASFIILFIAATTKRNSVKIFFLTLAAFNAVACLIYTIKNGNLPFDAIIDLIFRATDKSTTLSGRTHLWQIMSSEVSRHPWLGTGFGGFWVGQDGPSGAVIHRLDWGPPTQAHSGYIDGVNEIGILGMALFLVVIFFHITRCFKLHLNGMTASFIFHFTIVSSFLISNYTETSLLQGTNLYFVIVMCSVIEVYNRARTFDTTQVRLNSSPN